MARPKPTVDDYILAGAYYRLWKEIGSRAFGAFSRITSKPNLRKAMDAHERIKHLECDMRLEDSLLRDCPEMKEVFTSFFYGPISSCRNNIDEAIHDKVLEIFNEMFSDYETRRKLNHEEN